MIITATAITKSNTLNKEIFINKNNFANRKKGLLSIKRSDYKEKAFTHTLKMFAYIRKTNSRQIAAENSHGK